jgi:hypothetical protein
VNLDLAEDFDLTFGPQRKEPEEAETWQRELDRLCPHSSVADPADRAGVGS